jgi:PST family polysaccharide transporter
MAGLRHYARPKPYTSRVRRPLLRGTAWTLAARAVHVAAHFGSLLVLARHLDGAALGLAAMAAVVTGLLSAGADLGMGVLVVQRRDADDRRAAGLSEAAGFGAFLVVALLAPAIARAFGDPEGLVPLLRAGAAALVFAGFAATARARLARELRFDRLAAADAATAVAAAALRVAFAVKGFGAWSIVLGDVVAGGMGAALLWILAPPMRAGTDRRLLADGARVVGTRAADACFAQADRFVVGSRLGAAALGYYGFAMSHAFVLLQQLGPVVEQVAFPVLSRLRDDRAALARAYLAVTRTFALATVPFAALVWGLAPWFLGLLYPPHWAEAVPVLRALCVAAACAGLNSHPGLVWMALGRMRLRLRWSGANLVALAAVAVAGAEHGAAGVAYALAVRSLAATIVAQAITRRVAGVPHRAYVRALLPGVALGAALLLTTRALS